jgi:hypothetical protein
MLDPQQEESIIADPMGDDDIKFYFPNAKIITYKELDKYNSIDELLPNDKDFAFILIEESPNKGHWTCVTRHGDVRAFFDSYGGAPDSQLKWNPKTTNQKLGQGRKILSELLSNTNARVVYNPIDYQKDKEDINSCGRHCTFYILNMKDGKNLDEYYKYMKQLRSQTGKDYDEIVANFITKT